MALGASSVIVVVGGDGAGPGLHQLASSAEEPLEAGSQGEMTEMRQRLMALSKHGAKRRESQSSTLGILAAGTLHHCG